MCRSTIEYIASPATSTDDETPTHGAQRSRSASTASVPRRLPAALRVPGEKILPHPWNATRRAAPCSIRPGTAESADSSRFLPQPLDILPPSDDSTWDEMSVRRISERASWDSDIARDSVLYMSPEADQLQVPTTLPPAVVVGEEPSLVLLAKSPSRPAQQPAAPSSPIAAQEQSSGLWSQGTMPSAWKCDDAATYWQGRGAWQNVYTGVSPELSPSQSPTGESSDADLRKSRRETTMGVASSRYSPNAPLLLFLPPTSSASSTYSEASARRGSTFVRSSDETWGEDEEMTRSSSAVASSDARALVTLDELTTGEEQELHAGVYVNGTLDEMLTPAPVSDRERRPVKSTAGALRAAHARTASTASSVTTIQLKWQASQDTLHTPQTGGRLRDGYRNMDPPDSPCYAGIDSESDESEATTPAAAATSVPASASASACAPVLAPLVFHRAAVPPQSRRPKTSPVGRARTAHHVLAPPALGPGFTTELLELGVAR